MQLDLGEPIQSANPPDLTGPLPDPRVAQTAGGRFQIQRYHLTNGPQSGVELLVVDSGAVRAAICPTRGMSLWKANMQGVSCGWKSPVEGPIHPSFVALDEPSGIGWLDGFDELLVRCGLRSFGAPDFSETGQLLFPLHGRVGNLPARDVQVHVDPEHSLLQVQGEVHESRFLQYNLRLNVKITFAFGQPTIELHDTVLNAGATATTMQLLYHINLGSPVLDAGAKMHIGSAQAIARDAHAAEAVADWQTYLPPTAGYVEQVYFYASRADEDGWARALLASSDASRGVAVHFETKNLPYFSQWKNTVAESDGYVTGLEPGTGFPNPRSFEETHGRVVELAPGQSKEFRLKLEGVSSAERVSQLATNLAAQRGGQPMETFAFKADWCVPR